MQAYFYVAGRLNIIDQPNERSSHSLPTIRGGGIIFVIGLLFWFFADGFSLPYLTAGAILIALISFMDDLETRPVVLRLVFHVLAFVLMGCELSLFESESWWVVLLIFVIGIGTLNAFNFMDGINGMTGSYAFTTLVSIVAIDRWIINFTDERLVLAIVISVGVFLFYNFRRNARCFAGDVGSVTLAFILVFLVLQLIMVSNNYGWFILFGVYGVDSVGTIIYRVIKRENIFKAHRSHIYQYLVNELGYPHLLISAAYGILQLLINVMVIFYLPEPSFVEGVLLVLAMVIPYVWVREHMMLRIGKTGILTDMSNSRNK